MMTLEWSPNGNGNGNKVRFTRLSLGLRLTPLSHSRHSWSGGAVGRNGAGYGRVVLSLLDDDGRQQHRISCCREYWNFGVGSIQRGHHPLGRLNTNFVVT